MRNITYAIKDGKLHLEIDVSDRARKEAPLSGSGKNKLIASSEGNQDVGDGLKLGLNVFTKK